MNSPVVNHCIGKCGVRLKKTLSAKTSKRKGLMVARTLNSPGFRPRLVVAYADSAHAALSARHFRRLGWEVHLVSCGSDARRVAETLAPDAVIIDTQFQDEDGWLKCAKAMLATGVRRVVLVSPSVTLEEKRLARKVGAAAVVDRNRDGLLLADKAMEKSK
jgi:CheY-like chemotaxis protein